MEVLLIAIVSALNIACFLIGAKVGQKVNKGESIDIPSINPIKVYQEKQDKKEAEIKQNRIDTIIRNIEAYDGTGKGQEDVPRGVI